MLVWVLLHVLGLQLLLVLVFGVIGCVVVITRVVV